MIDLCSAATFDRARPDFPEDKVFVLTVANTEPQSSETGPDLPPLFPFARGRKREQAKVWLQRAARPCRAFISAHPSSERRLTPAPSIRTFKKYFSFEEKSVQTQNAEKSTQLPRKSAER
jgi:hypothetical protein